MISGEGRVDSSHTIAQAPSELRRRVLVPDASTVEVESDIWKPVERFERWQAVKSSIAPLVAVALVIALWGISLPGINIRNINDYGLVSVLPPAIFVAMALLTVSFSLLVTRQQVPAFVLAIHVIALIVIVHGTTALLYELPRYSWTYKHVGVVDYIMRNGSINPTIDIYHNWPGFFALSAFFAAIVGTESPLSYAGWAPVFFNILYIAPLLFLFRTFSIDTRVTWLGVWFFYLTSWVGQDYFAPQALSYFFYIIILGMCVAWFRVNRTPAGSRLRSSSLMARILAPLHKILNRPYLDDAPAAIDTPLQRLGAMAVIILVFIVIVSSHQLTPYAIVASVASLIIFRRCSARLLPVLMAIIAAAWALFMAATYMNGNIQWIVQSIGELLSNVDTNVADLSRASAGRIFTAHVSRGLTAALWGLALLGTIRRFCAGHRDLHILLLAIAPFPLIVTQSYGGEMIFRIFLFTLPPMAFLAASTFIPSSSCRVSQRTSITLVLVSLALLGGLLFAYYGKERMNYFTSNEIQTVEYLHENAPKGSLVLVLSSNLPYKYRNYEQFEYHVLTDNRDFTDGKIWIENDLASGDSGRNDDKTANRIAYIKYLMSDLGYPRTYLVLTRSEDESIVLLDMMSQGDLSSMEQALTKSSSFRVIMSNPDAKVYVLAKDSRGETGQ